MDRQPLVGVDRGPAKWTPQKKEVRNGSMYSPRRVSVEGPPTPPTPPTPPAPTSDEENNASDAEAPSSKAFASPYAVPASTTLQRERRAWRALQSEGEPTPRSPFSPEPARLRESMRATPERTRSGLFLRHVKSPSPSPPSEPPPPKSIDASPAAAARRDLDRRRRGARAFAEEERRRARAQRVERAQAERRYKHRLSNEAVRAENARQATLAEHARARVFVAERPEVFNGGVERPERVLPKPRRSDPEDLPPLPPKRLVKEEVCAEEEDFEGLLDDAAPAPEAPAPAPAPPAPTSPTSPTGYSDDAEDFEDDESDAEDEAAIGVGVQVEARFGGEEDWYPGTVKAVNADGTYQIAYDDGDEEDSVAPEYVRLRPSSP
jgi:hypothetical protein